jgi:uncharacterized protein (TIGR02246 family)
MGTRLIGLSVLLAVGAGLWAAGEDDQKRSDPEKNQSSAEEQRKDSRKSVDVSKDEAAATKRQIAAEEAEQASPDERAIRQIVQDVEDAFNQADAEKLTALFSPHAELINPGGAVVSGPDAIREFFEAEFRQNPDAELRIQIESIRVLGPNVAIEEGMTRLFRGSDSEPELARYTVVYSKEDDAWKMISARDIPIEAAVDNHLEGLAWLIGDWVDECSECIVLTSYRWADSHRFIIGEFQVATPGEGTLEGAMHIGWDPQLKQIRSWVFDSEGGFGTGVWARNEDTWIVKLSGVMRDGHTTTATHRMRRVSDDQAVMESRDRVIGGILIDDGDPVTMVRRGPSPESLSELRNGE